MIKDRETSQPDLNTAGYLAPGGEDEILRLRTARDAALQAAQTAIRDTTRLTRLLTILSEPTPIEFLLDRLLSTLSELFSADIVVLLDPMETGTFSPLAAIGLPEDMIHQRMLDTEGSYVAVALHNRMSVLTVEASTDPKVDSILRELGTETAVWVPVSDSHAARGVLILARCRPVPFAHADVDLLTAMAYRIGLALEHAQRNSQLEQIIQTSHEISYYLDEATVGAETVRMFSGIVRADAAALVLSNQDSPPRCVAQFGLDPAQTNVWVQLAESLLSHRDLISAQPYSTSDLREVAGQFALEALDNCPVRALLAVPIGRNNQAQGLLYAMRFSTTSFSPDTLQIAMLYAGQTSALLENARLYRAACDEVTERIRAEQALRTSEERFRALIRSVSDVIAILKVDGTICYTNPAVEMVWGCSADALFGQNMLDRVHPDDVETMHNLLSLLLVQPNTTLTRLVRVRQGENIWRDFEVILTNLLDEPAVSGIVATFHDVTERKTYEQELTTLAFRDPLTGLANRSYFKDRLQHALIRADAEGHSIAVFFFDLDDFKIVNDSLGHDAGDQVLQVVADRMRACLRREDTAARLGGDEFTIFVEGVTAVEQVIPIAHRLIAALRDPIRIADRNLFIGSSLGIAISIPNQDSIDDLLRKADLAMYHAKSTTKGSYAIFDAQLNAAAMERLEVEIELRQALELQEFRVYYQPVVSLDDGRICTVEALIRWQHPRRGLVPPSRVIPIAEETGLIIELGQWVLEEACRQVSDWQRRYQENLSLNVNLSARQFRHAEIVNNISVALHNSGLKPFSLTLEITEGNLIHDPMETIAKLRAMKKLGVRLAIDDFGIGYSNLSYLKQFPVDILKIDRSFIRGIEWDPHDKAIVRSVIALADAFELSVTGEGIETEEQAAQLRALGCNHGQGYLFAPPLPADSFETFLEKDRQRARVNGYGQR
ncbi:diguanylate cyclase/phosphodiesterase with PAS/PAC sensor(S) [Candidatus Vecturithrix granuli]|uniref:Diguanylate cyclase/phosphodiesterase with PAS/PAC sensor(S) n=1 Tax=Vecturithrix granuli TaxID=1499967 RepID=A0A0S6WCL8_VECG1|nr:diguanylate cyclase/phosphodiesterase with PAS/PAC sensor(S) [Candidatus Vecturithrix granuli]